MSQVSIQLPARKLPIGAMLSEGAKLGFRHFWALLAVMAVTYIAMGLLFWSTFTRIFAMTIQAQRIAAARPGDPSAALAQARVIESMFAGPSVYLLYAVALIIGAAMFTLLLRIVELGPRAALAGSAGQWGHRLLVMLWRYICGLVIFLVIFAAFVLAVVFLGGIVAAFVRASPGVVSATLMVLLSLAAFVFGVWLFGILYAIGLVSFTGTSCDERVTLRGAYALLKGNRLRAGGANVLVYVIMVVTLLVLLTVLSLAGVSTLFSGMANPAAAGAGLVMGTLITEIIVFLPGMIWWFGVGVAIYRFVTDADRKAQVFD